METQTTGASVDAAKAFDRSQTHDVHSVTSTEHKGNGLQVPAISGPQGADSFHVSAWSYIPVQSWMALRLHQKLQSQSAPTPSCGRREPWGQKAALCGLKTKCHVVVSNKKYKKQT